MSSGPNHYIHIHPWTSECFEFTLTNRNISGRLDYQKSVPWLVSVVDMQVDGYFPDVDHEGRSHLVTILSSDSDCRARKHLVNHVRLWKKDQNMAALDEIARVTSLYQNNDNFIWPDNSERMRPEQLLKILRQAELEKKAPLQHYVHLNSLPGKGR